MVVRNLFANIRRAQLLLIFAGFHMAVSLCRMAAISVLADQGVNLMALPGWGPGHPATALLMGLLGPLEVALLLVLASVGVRCGYSWGRGLVVVAGLAGMGLFLESQGPFGIWTALGLVSAAQCANLLWTATLGWPRSAYLE